MEARDGALSRVSRRSAGSLPAARAAACARWASLFMLVVIVGVISWMRVAADSAEATITVGAMPSAASWISTPAPETELTAMVAPQWKAARVWMRVYVWVKTSTGRKRSDAVKRWLWGRALIRAATADTMFYNEDF